MTTSTFLSDAEGELLQAMINANLEFVIVGGAAVNAHGHRRRRRDIEILVRQTRSNLARVTDVQLNWLHFNSTKSIRRSYGHLA
jgi:hypothetical protein